MKNLYSRSILQKSLFVFFVLLLSFSCFAQTSWKGTTNTDWFNSSNWTAGVPTSSIDAIIGDRSISNYPVINTTAANCRSVTIGGTNTGQLTMNANLNVAGNVTINSNGTLNQPANTITVAGNWTASGNYIGTTSTYVVFNGTNQTIGGTIARFESLTINASSYVTLLSNVVINNKTVVNGTWDTNETPASYRLSGTTSFTIGATGTVRIKSADAPSCFQFTGGPTLIPGCTVDYASTTVTQTIYSQFTYDNLRISGTGLKILSGDYSGWNTTGVDVGNVYVASGTLDLFSYSLSRGATGGTLTVANGAALRIGGTNSLPTFLNYVFNTTSTVEYYGSTQVISPASYGNLTLTGTSTASFSIPSGKTITCGNNFLISGGTFNVSNSAGTSTLTATGSYTQTGGTVNVSSSTGTGVVNINTDMNISGGTFNVIANASAPATTVTINGDLNISGAARFNLETVSSSSTAIINVNGDFNSSGTSVADINGAGGVIDFGVGTITSNAININGNFTKSGVGTFGSTSTSAAKGFVFNGTGTQIFNYSGANSAGIQYTVNAGATLKMASGLTLPAGTTPACSFTVNGTLDFGTNSINSTTNPTFLLASTGKLITAHTGGINGSITGTWASKTFTSGAQYEFNSAVANQNFGFTGLTITTPGTILVSNTGGTVSADVNVIFGTSGNLIVNNNSILNAAAFTFTFGTLGKVLENGKMQTANANGFAGAVNTTIVSTNAPVITLGSTSTIEYNATIGQKISAINYVNLTSSSTGARTLFNSGTIGISGVFLAGTNAYTNTGSTVSFNSTINQNIPSGFSFNNLTINNGAGVTLLGNVSVNGAANALTFTNGKITTGIYKVTLGTTVTVSGAGTGKYVFGNMERDFPKNNLVFTYDIGGAIYYSPVTITFAKINANGGTFLVGAVDGEHPNLSTSNIVSGNDIPRYWKVTNTGAVSYTTYSVAFNWNSAESYTGLSTTALEVADYNASAWTYPTLSGTTTVTTISASGLASDDQFVVGQKCTTTSASFSYNSTTLCTSGGTAVATLGTSATAGIFTASPSGLSINAATGTITLSTSIPGTYTVTNTAGTGGCAKTATATVTVTAPPSSAAFSYTSTTMCTSAGTAVATLGAGATAGTFTASPSGLSINAATGTITLSTSIPGTYTVTHTAGLGGCTKTATTTVTVTAPPSATISYIGNPFCNTTGAASASISGTSGGIFSSIKGLVINSASGLVDLGASTAGTYTVTYTVAASNGCSQFQTTTVITINPIGVWTGATSNKWNVSSNWQCGVIPSNTTNVVIPSGLFNYPSISSGTIGINDLTLQTDATITITNGILQIAGLATTTGGDLIATNGKVEFNGTTAQTIPAGLFYADTVKDLIITNPAGVTLAGPVKVTSTVDFGNVNNSVLTSNGNLTLVSTASNSANLTDITNGGINTGNKVSGDVIVERYIQGRRAYRFLTAPVNSTTSIKENWMENASNPSTSVNYNPNPNHGTHITGISPVANGFDATSTNNASMFTFNNTAQTWSGIPNTSGKFSAGNGYRIMVRGSRSVDLSNNNAISSTTTLRATGKLITGPVTFTKVNGGGTPGMPVLSSVTGTYGFIANPYASSVDWNSLLTTATDISSTLYIYDPTVSGSNGRGQYVSYNATLNVKSIITSMVGKDVQSGQAFFVQTTGPNPSLTFKETHKSNTFLPVFRTANDVPHMSVELLLPSSLNASGAADGTAVYFSDDYTSAISDDDSYKFTNLDENIAILRNGTPLSLEGRKPVTGSDSVPLKIWQLTQKSYTLKITLGNFADNVTGYLEDKYLNASTPLNNGETLIPFSITSNAASSASDRFMIVFESFATLPVKLTGIKACVKNKAVEVDWTAESESNMNRYEVESSTDAQQFKTVGSVTAKNNPGVSSDYTVIDVKPNNGDNYYRIKSIEKSGDVKYSEVVKVRIENKTGSVSVLTNPGVKNCFTLSFNNFLKGTYAISVINNSGQKVYEGRVMHSGGSDIKSININNYLPAGIYKVQLYNGNNVQNLSLLIQ